MHHVGEFHNFVTHHHGLLLIEIKQGHALIVMLVLAMVPTLHYNYPHCSEEEIQPEFRRMPTGV
jgi:hypothetical protein